MLVTGLEKTRFQVWEDKVQQEIRYFSTNEVPISVGVIFDISGSMADKLPVSRDAVATFLKPGTRQTNTHSLNSTTVLTWRRISHRTSLIFKIASH